MRNRRIKRRRLKQAADLRQPMNSLALWDGFMGTARFFQRIDPTTNLIPFNAAKETLKVLCNFNLLGDLAQRYLDAAEIRDQAGPVFEIVKQGSITLARFRTTSVSLAFPEDMVAEEMARYIQRKLFTEVPAIEESYKFHSWVSNYANEFRDLFFSLVLHKPGWKETYKKSDEEHSTWIDWRISQIEEHLRWLIDRKAPPEFAAV